MHLIISNSNSYLHSPANTIFNTTIVNNKEIYPLFARTVPDSAGESSAIVKYFCDEVNTRHLAVPHEQQEYGTTMLSSIVSAATEYCPEMKILPVSIPETGLSTDEDIKKAVAAIKNSGYRHAFFIGTSQTLNPLLEMGAEEGIAATPDYFWTGKSAFVLFCCMNSCVEYEVSIIWMLI